jgi:hypothetical protein
MKKYISYLLASALLAPVFVSCNERLQEEEIPVRTHKVLFSASQAETRTGLSIEGNTVTPDWNKTDESNIHLFETDANNATVYGETLKITTGSDKETAKFEADFPENMTIAVGVNDDTSTGGSAARVAPYSYTAVVAQKAAGETLAFVIPAEQHPDAETLKDPNADFLVGYGAETVDTPHNYDEPVVDLYFDRAAAMGRVAISNFSDNGEKVQSVTISTTAGLTGSAALSAIDFEKATVSFTRTEGPLSLVYDNGADVPADGTFYAYFVAIPGEATISSIEVVTDQYVYTKEINKATTLSAKTFKNFTLDLSTAEKQSAAPAVTSYTKVTSTAELEVGTQYLLVFEGLEGDTDGDGDPKVFNPVLNDDGTQFAKATTSALDVTISNGVIESSDFDDCQFTLEAGYYLKADKANKYIYPHQQSNTGGVMGAEATATSKLEISFTNAGIVEIKYDSRYLVWSTSSHYFSANSDVSGQYSTGICLYKLDDGRQKQSPSFSADSAEYDLYTGKWTKEVPTLNDARGTVTYESSDPTVATVDASTGAVTPIKKGTATITAKAAGNATYRPGEASYTVTVTSSDPSVPTYTKVTSTSELEAGAQYILVYETASKAFKPILNSGGTYFTKSTANALDVTIVDGEIQSSDLEECLITLEEGYYLFIESANKYLYPGASGDSALGAEDKTSGHTVAISFSSGIVTIARSGDANYHLYWSSSNYFSGINSNSSSYAANICLYKLDDGRQKQNFSFVGSSAEYDLGTSTWKTAVPDLDYTNAHGEVTYSSSDPAVATVNATTGAVTPLMKGTTTITARAAGNATYKPGSASYLLTVSNSKTPKYVKAEELEADGQYLIVSNGYVLKNNNGSAAATAVTVTDDTMMYDPDNSEIWTASSSGELVNSEKYLRLSSSSLSIGSKSGTASNNQWTYNPETPTLKVSNYYLYYSTSNSRWSVSTSASDTHVAALYVLDDGKPKARKLAFSSTTATVNIHEKTTPLAFTGAPTLSGKGIEDVTYSIESANATPVAQVASIDASTGAVTVIGVGEVVITASASATASYQAGSASYTLKIIDEAMATYTKVTSTSGLEAGATYLVVFEGLPSNSKTENQSPKVFKPALNSAGTQFEKQTSSAIAVEIENETISSNDYEDCQFTLEAGYYLKANKAEKYLYPDSDGSRGYIYAESTASHALSITFDGGIAVIKPTSGSYYLVWSTSSYYFSSNNAVSGTYSSGICLYKKN